ncbi:MFS transporter [Candidatus Bathyarchaeota archaeon]|nr:MFS transporter [Candidatus Bathyarchaeota archaeon]MBS7630052.1 MFS transporter [Candidatus Bathyarchaeota archaeon]
MEGKEKIFLAVFAANFVSTFGETIPQPFQPLFLTSLGLSAAVVGLFYNVKNIVQTIIRTPVGVLSDKLGRRRLMSFGLILLAISPLIMALSHDPVLPLLAMLLGGLGVSIYYPPSEAYASSLYPPEKIGEAMGRFHLGWAISAIIGPFVGGFLTLVFPSFRQIYFVASAVTLLSVGIILLFTREEIDTMRVSHEFGNAIRSLPATMIILLKNKKVLISSIVVFIHSFTNWWIPAFFPLFASGIGFEVTMIGIALTVNSLLMGLALPIMGKVSDKIGRLKPIIAGLSLSLVGFAFIPFFKGALSIIFLMAIIGFGAALVFPVSQALMLEAIPEGEKGAGTGLWGTSMSLGGALGIFTMSALSSFASLDWIFFFSAIFTCISLIVLALLKSYFTA